MVKSESVVETDDSVFRWYSSPSSYSGFSFHIMHNLRIFQDVLVKPHYASFWLWAGECSAPLPQPGVCEINRCTLWFQTFLQDAGSPTVPPVNQGENHDPVCFLVLYSLRVNASLNLALETLLCTHTLSQSIIRFIGHNQRLPHFRLPQPTIATHVGYWFHMLAWNCIIVSFNSCLWLFLSPRGKVFSAPGLVCQ